jgi:hypothetical protein
VAALAVMLMALLVVQAPIATVDQFLHDAGHGHPANAFVGAVVDLPEHHERDHGHESIAVDHDEHDDAPAAQAVSGEPASDPATSGLNHHHHHDGPSVYGLTASLSLPVVWSLSTMPFRLDDDLRNGIDAFQQDRPPKTHLAHVA